MNFWGQKYSLCLGFSTQKPHFSTLDHMGNPLKIKISKIGLRHVLSWSKLSLEPKCHDPGTFFTFFALDRFGGPKLFFVFFTKVVFLPETRAKILGQKYFFYKGDPPKNGNFSKIFFLHLLISKIFTLSKFHSPIC